jgi:hypothetical protein
MRTGLRTISIPYLSDTEMGIYCRLPSGRDRKPIPLHEPEKERPRRLQDQREIQEQRPMKDILKIEVDFFLRRMLLTQPIDLRESCQPRFYSQALALPHGIMLYPFRRFGARTDQAHFAFQHVEKLGQLREAKLYKTLLVTIPRWDVAVNI